MSAIRIALRWFPWYSQQATELDRAAYDCLSETLLSNGCSTEQIPERDGAAMSHARPCRAAVVIEVHRVPLLLPRLIEWHRWYRLRGGMG